MKEELFILSNPCGCSVKLLKGSLESPTGIDFITKYLDPSVTMRYRTPKHEHIAADIVAKGAAYPESFCILTSYLRGLLGYLTPTNEYPEASQVGNYNPTERLLIINTFTQKHIFNIEDLLVIYELVVWQERTRYPGGRLSTLLLDCFERGDSFTAIGHATRKRV